MKNTAINTLSYTGIVTLSQYIGERKTQILQTHNRGGNSLFSFLADCLIGDFTLARATRPSKVMLLQCENPGAADNEKEFKTHQHGGGFFWLITPPEKVEGSLGSRVRYSFVIPKEIVSNLSDFDNLYLGLYSEGASAGTGESKDDANNFAAICKLELAKNSTADAALVVDWELVISNVNVSAG